MFIHGSMQWIEPGTIMKGSGLLYEKDWGLAPFYRALKRHRPEHVIAHHEGVFMSTSMEDISLSGGGEEFVAILEPEGIIQRHDMNWSAQVSCLLDTHSYDSHPVIDACRNYWNGTPHDDENVWEYICKEAKVIECMSWADFEQAYPEMVNAKVLSSINGMDNF